MPSLVGFQVWPRWDHCEINLCGWRDSKIQKLTNQLTNQPTDQLIHQLFFFFFFAFPPNSDTDYGIFNVRTNVYACDCTRGCTDTVRRVCAGSWLWEKKNKQKTLPHRGIEPASAACQSDALPNELLPHSYVIDWVLKTGNLFILALQVPSCPLQGRTALGTSITSVEEHK